MKIKERFPSIAQKGEILFVQAADMLDGREYFDAQNADAFAEGSELLKKALQHYRVLALGFAGLSYFSSLAISQLIGLQEELTEMDRHLLLYDLSPKVKIVLDELGLTGYLQIYGSQMLVLRHFRNESN